MDSSSNIKDYELGLDDLGQPNIIDMSTVKYGKMNTAILMIARLLYLKKGTYADQPDIGIDIVNRYRFSFDDELITLSNELKEQIYQFAPEFTPVTVNCSFALNKQQIQTVVITLAIQGVVYRLIYNPQTNTLESIEGT